MSACIQSWLVFILTLQINFVLSLYNNEIKLDSEEFKLPEQMKILTEKINIPQLSYQKNKRKDNLMQDTKINPKLKRDYIYIYTKQFFPSKQLHIRSYRPFTATRSDLTNLQTYSRKVKNKKLLGETKINRNKVKNHSVKFNLKMFHYHNYFQEKVKTEMMEPLIKYNRDRIDFAQEKKTILIYPGKYKTISAHFIAKQLGSIVNKSFSYDQYAYDKNNLDPQITYSVEKTNSNENISDRNTVKRRPRSTFEKNAMEKITSESEKDFTRQDISDLEAQEVVLDSHKNKFNVNNSETKQFFTGNLSSLEQNNSEVHTHLDINVNKNMNLKEPIIDINDSTINIHQKKTNPKPAAIDIDMNYSGKKIIDNIEDTEFNNVTHTNQKDIRKIIENTTSKEFTSTIIPAYLKSNYTLQNNIMVNISKQITQRGNSDVYLNISRNLISISLNSITEINKENSTEAGNYQNSTEMKKENKTEADEYQNVNTTNENKSIDTQTRDILKSMKNLKKDVQSNLSQNYSDRKSDTLQRNHTDNLNEDNTDEVTATIKYKDYLETYEKPSSVGHSSNTAIFNSSLAVEDDENIKHVSKIINKLEKTINVSTTGEKNDIDKNDTVTLDFKNLWIESYETHFPENRKIDNNHTVSGNVSKKLTDYETLLNKTSFFLVSQNNMTNKASNSVETLSTYRDGILKGRNFKTSFSNQTMPIVQNKTDKDEAKTKLSLEAMHTSTESILEITGYLSIINTETDNNVTNMKKTDYNVTNMRETDNNVTNMRETNNNVTNTRETDNVTNMRETDNYVTNMNKKDNYENVTRTPRNENYGAKFINHDEISFKTSHNTKLHSLHTTPTSFYKNSDEETHFDRRNSNNSKKEIIQQVVVKNCIDDTLVYSSIVRHYRTRYNLTSMDLNCTFSLSLSIPQEKSSSVNVINAIEKNILNRYAESLKILESNIIDNRIDAGYEDLTDKERILMYLVYALSVIVGILLLAIGFHCIYVYKKLKKSSDFYPGIEMNDYKFTQIPRPSITFPSNRSMKME